MARRNPLGDLDVGEILQRLQSILINAAEGQRSVGDDAQYGDLRRELDRRRFGSPRFVSLHPTVDSFAAYIKGIKDRRQRVKLIRDGFEAAINPSSEVEVRVNPSSWTGVQSRAARLGLVRESLPLAQAAVEGLIASLSEPGPNGGPVLDHREEAINELRKLHAALGNLLSAIDNDQFSDDLGNDLAAEAVRYAKRAARELRDDPMPYLASSLMLALFSSFGWSGIGGHLAGVALAVKKNTKRSGDG